MQVLRHKSGRCSVTGRSKLASRNRTLMGQMYSHCSWQILRIKWTRNWEACMSAFAFRRCNTRSSSITLLQPGGCLCTTRFNTRKPHILPTKRIYVCCIILTTNSDHFFIEIVRYLRWRYTVFSARYAWIFKYYFDELMASKLRNLKLVTRNERWHKMTVICVSPLNIQGLDDTEFC